MALSRKKKNRLTMIILLSLIIVFGAAYGIITAILSKEDDVVDAGDSHSLVLSTIAAENIEKVTFSNANFTGTIIRSYETVDGTEKAVYTLQGEEEFPLDQSLAAGIFTNVSLAAKEFLTDEGTPSEYGLEDAAVTAEITSTTGEVVKLAVGDAVGMVDKGGFYVNVNGGSEIYLTQSSMTTVLNYSKTDLIETDIPKIDTTNATEVIVEVAEDGVISTTKFVHDSAASAALYGAAYQNWFVIDESGRKLPGDDEQVTQYIEDNYASMYAASAIDYKAENFADYGLDNPTGKITIKVNETDGDGNVTGTKEYVLLVGNSYNDDYHYVTMEGDSRTYIMSLTRIQAMFNIDLADYVYSYYCIVNVGTLSAVSITKDGQTDRFEITQSVETDENGNSTITVSEVKKNGEIMDLVTDFQTFYTSMAVQTWKSLAENNEDEAGEVYLTLTYERTEDTYKTLNYSFEKYNDNYVLVRVNGVKMYIISNDSLNEIKGILP